MPVRREPVALFYGLKFTNDACGQDGSMRIHKKTLAGSVDVSVAKARWLETRLPSYVYPSSVLITEPDKALPIARRYHVQDIC